MQIVRLKKAISLTCVLTFIVMCLSACGDKNSSVFTIDGEEIDRETVDVFGYIYVTEHRFKDRSEWDSFYDENRTYEEYYKDELEQDIIYTVLVKNEAADNGIELSDDEKELAAKRASSIVDVYGKGTLSVKGIEQSDIEKVYEWKLSADKYMASLNDDEKETNNDNADTAENDSDTRYINVYQVTFLTALLDDDNMVQADSDGNVLKISSEEISEMKERAENFLEKVKDGASIEELLKDEPATVTGSETTLKYKDLSDSYKKEIDKMSVGDVSGIIEGDYGYYIVKLLNDNDEAHAKLIEDYESEVKNEAEADELYQRLFDSKIGEYSKYRQDEEWEKIAIGSYLPQSS